MILVYTGNGKGKTSACLGQCVRALGQDMRVAFGQFMKRDGAGGEQKILAGLLGDNFRAGGCGFFTKPEQFAEHRKTCEHVLAWAAERLASVDMLILDEALYALGSKLITREELEALMERCSSASTPHLVLSGRGLPDWLQEKAHLVTEMREIKHPYSQGIAAQKGVEF